MTEQTTGQGVPSATAGEAIQNFIKQRLADTESKGAFTADQLRFYVNNNVVGGVSPSSADRVLRLLRQQGKINYYVANRPKSLYKALPLMQEADGPQSN